MGKYLMEIRTEIVSAADATTSTKPDMYPCEYCDRMINTENLVVAFDPHGTPNVMCTDCGEGGSMLESNKKYIFYTYHLVGNPKRVHTQPTTTTTTTPTV